MHKTCSQTLALLVCAVIIVGLFQVGLMQSWDFWKQVGTVSLLVGLALLMSGGFGVKEEKKEAVN